MLTGIGLVAALRIESGERRGDGVRVRGGGQGVEGRSHGPLDAVGARLVSQAGPGGMNV